MGGRKANLSAIWPNTVDFPVFTSNTRAVPLLTLVPMNTQLLRSLKLAVSATTPSFFSTGKVSPVSTAWLMKKSFDTNTMPSAGIKLPADRATTSPGTTRSEGIVLNRPSRKTLEWILTLARSFLIALLATYSWVKPSTVLPSTMANTTPASTHSAANMEMTDATIKISTKGFLNWLINNPKNVSPAVASSTLAPICRRLTRATCWVRPSSLESSAWVKSLEARLQ